MPMAIPLMMGAATAVAAYGAYQQGQAAKKAANYNATVNLQNAEIARSNATMQASQQQRETLLRMGAIRAAAGASGGTGEGSVLDVLADTAAQSELERQNILYQGELTARGYKSTATLDKYQGKTAARAGAMKAGAELLGGAASAGMAYNELNKPRMPATSLERT